MAYKAFSSAGSQLYLGNASPQTWLLIRGVEGLQGPTASKPDIEVTAIDDTAAQFIAGIPDYGNITFDLFWDPAETTHQLLKDAFDTVGSVSYFKLIYNDAGGANAYFQGEVKQFEGDLSKGAAAKFKVSVKLSGPFQVIP